MRFNWGSKISDYRGLLTFPATLNIAHIVTIPLFLKTVPVPVKQPKVTEINTVTQVEPQGNETYLSALFFGAPDGLNIQLSGFILTPLSKDSTNPYNPTMVWDPTVDGTDNGIRLGLKGWSYGDLIAGYLEGRLNVVQSGRWNRTDPVSYTDPYGYVYNNPVISVWDCNNQRPKRLQQFSMTIFLEK